MILYEFERSPSGMGTGTNLFGHQSLDGGQSQEHNLLYIALTRGTQSLTLLLNRRTKHVTSPYLPIEMIHYSMEMWASHGAHPHA